MHSFLKAISDISDIPGFKVALALGGFNVPTLGEILARLVATSMVNAVWPRQSWGNQLGLEGVPFWIRMNSFFYEVTNNLVLCPALVEIDFRLCSVSPWGIRLSDIAFQATWPYGCFRGTSPSRGQETISCHQQK